MLPQQLFNALVLGSVYALFSMGFTLTFGVLRVINLLYGFYVAAGAFLALVLVRDVGLPLWAAGLVGRARNRRHRHGLRHRGVDALAPCQGA